MQQKITLTISYQRFYEIILFLAAVFCNIGSQTLLQDCKNSRSLLNATGFFTL